MPQIEDMRLRVQRNRNPARSSLPIVDRRANVTTDFTVSFTKEDLGSLWNASVEIRAWEAPGHSVSLFDMFWVEYLFDSMGGLTISIARHQTYNPEHDVKQFFERSSVVPIQVLDEDPARTIRIPTRSGGTRLIEIPDQDEIFARATLTSMDSDVKSVAAESNFVRSFFEELDLSR